MGYTGFTFRENELRAASFMKYPDWYPDWEADAFEQLVAKNKQLETEFTLGHWGRYDYDLPTGTLTFSQDGVAKVVAEIQVAGSTRMDDWQWAWSNKHLPEDRTADATRVRAFGQENGIEILVRPHTRDGKVEALGWALSAVMVRLTDAVGVYRSPLRGGGFLFVTLKNVAFAG